MVSGAVQESLGDAGTEVGLLAAGGKGAASRKSPAQIAVACEHLGRDPDTLVHASRTAAKMDSAAVHDGHQLYQHAFLFTSAGDPARFVFAHGGKDGLPFPADRPTYDRTIEVLSRAVDRARIDRSERVKALKRLAMFRRDGFLSHRI